MTRAAATSCCQQPPLLLQKGQWPQPAGAWRGFVSSTRSFAQPCGGAGEKNLVSLVSWYRSLQAEINGGVSPLYCFRACYPEEKRVCDSPRRFFLQQCTPNFFLSFFVPIFRCTHLKHFTYWVWFGKGTSALSSREDNFS